MLIQLLHLSLYDLLSLIDLLALLFSCSGSLVLILLIHFHFVEVRALLRNIVGVRFTLLIENIHRRALACSILMHDLTLEVRGAFFEHEVDIAHPR